ncbi:baseplate wedge subunit [uncultured Caudovirales phage]|uniref:Baseplate wedge subunit n=1 Tax=uncultured Caudovirales phage TaxID=2100421 RepID=A0A6J7X1Y5_9CAUD|nr:baseplate wedge subunit [uncultured Caudovirales phage]
MANTGFLDVSELSFDGIKSNLKTFLQSKTDFKDYNFEGSNLSNLLDVLSYNTYMNAYYLNMIGSEMFLDTAQIKSSVISHAKDLNYLPRSKTSARAKVTFTINTGNDRPNYIIIPENYSVRTSYSGKNYEFTTNEDIVVTNLNGVYSTDSVFVYEGKIVEEFFTVSSDTRFILQSDNIDTNSIKVNVIKSSSDSSNTAYAKAENLFGLTSNSEIYFIQGYGTNQYEIAFGDGVSGKSVTNGNIVKVKYRSTNGEEGNRASSFTPSGLIDGYNVTVSTNVIAADGSEREDVDSIKKFAPRHYATQNRAVTREDYITLVREAYPQIKTVNVYGGEDADPPQYGKVIITAIPYGASPILSKELKEDIIRYLTTKSITTEPLIYDPEYMYAEINVDVFYNPNLTTKTPLQLRTDVLSAIQMYDNDHLNNFGDDIRKSKLSSYIDNADGSIVSNDLILRAMYKIAPLKAQSTRVNFSFSNPIYNPISRTYTPGEIEAVRSDTFTYSVPGVIGTSYTARISDDGNGILRLYYSAPNLPVNILIPNIGTVDYTTGNMEFDIYPYNYTDVINFYAKLDTADIAVIKPTKFLKIDYTKVVINMIPKTA